ncbi:alpha/beta superfamily hydrolase [Natronospira proteinivora]|uniref:Palmitoyl-protein thioesterase ABHD10, mitochondrial n=1 Tax=Natronospira proteinivora TaxID=1807133 RepID=A0ABT1GD55_9GAMM|nr:alpha/beta fold hydrolase [Natronospira proteinivora]MCP1728198.1 alpha/beta superfamily hydrolase [Natronospira proteinivora]
MGSKAFQFKGGEGQQLSGVLEEPEGLARGWAIFAHCFTCTRDSKGAVAVSRALASRGIGVLRFDFTGLGESEGDFGAAGIGGDIRDLKAAAGALEDVDIAVDLMVGHSLGGAAVLHAAGEIDSVRAIATIAAPADPAHILRVLGEQRATIEKDGKAEVRIAGRRFTISRGFVEDMESRAWEDTIAGLRRPLMVMHAPEDEVVGIENAGLIFQAALHPKSFLSLDAADHLLTRRKDAEWVAEIIAGWASRYLPD